MLHVQANHMRRLYQLWKACKALVANPVHRCIHAVGFRAVSDLGLVRFALFASPVRVPVHSTQQKMKDRQGRSLPSVYARLG